ncbi:hypothetical protein BC828DRAFT_438479 [Blastocladiella britannica]|nr:hypothetical protein BC828DRAFT_438479 [Blastocladiella britannica]
MTGDLTAIKTFYLKVPSMHPPIQLEGSEHGVLVDATLESGHVCILEWVVATAAQEQWEIDWHDWSWGSVAKLGHISALEWALRNDIFQLSAFSHAVVGPAARHGQLQVLVWYHAQLQVRGGETFSMGVSNMIARSAAQGAHRRVLDWWWVNIASTFTPCLPYPKPFDGIVAAALSNGDLATVQWLWDKYDAHHTPDHAFATPAALISALSSGSLLAVEWLWAIAAQPEWVEILYNWNGEPYTSYLGNRFATSLPLLKWWYQTQAYAGGDPVVVCTRAYTFACAKAGAVEVLDWVISLPDQSKVVWGESLAATALLHRQQQLPTQLQPTSFFDRNAGYSRGLAVMDWWETRIGFPGKLLLALGTETARHGNYEWVLWWCTRISACTHRETIRVGLIEALLAARSAWARQLLMNTAADLRFDVDKLVAGHTCVRHFNTIEAVCWWFVYMRGDAAKESWKSQKFGALSSCEWCQERMLDAARLERELL